MVNTKTNTEISLMAHLMRRAGFGASRTELEARCEKGYEDTVEESVVIAFIGQINKGN